MWKPDGFMAWQTGQCICHVQHLNGGGNFGFPNRWCWGTQQSCSHWQGVEDCVAFVSGDPYIAVKVQVEVDHSVLPPPPRRYTLGRAFENVEVFQFSLGIHLPCPFSAILILWNHLLTSKRSQDISADKIQGGINPARFTAQPEGNENHLKNIGCCDFF